MLNNLPKSAQLICDVNWKTDLLISKPFLPITCSVSMLWSLCSRVFIGRVTVYHIAGDSSGLHLLLRIIIISVPFHLELWPSGVLFYSQNLAIKCYGLHDFKNRDIHMWPYFCSHVTVCTFNHSLHL